jgi:hypothetical protein
MRLARVAGSIVATVVLVLACGRSGAPASSPGPAASPTPSASPSAATGPEVWLPEWADARVPAEVVNRRPLAFCGVEEAPVPRAGEYIDATVRNCFWAAKLDGREAEFVSVQPTMEGDRIATIYRLRPDGGVDLLLDSTQDRFGGGGWTLTTCDRLVEEAGDRLFGVDGCAEGRALP